jgi:hypothetical protein
VARIHNGVVLSNKEEWNYIVHSKKDGTGGYYVERDETNIMCFLSYTESRPKNIIMWQYYKRDCFR